MDINKILAELRAEREEIERALLALGRIGKRRGRPPQWLRAMEERTRTEQKKKQSGRSKDQET